MSSSKRKLYLVKDSEICSVPEEMDSSGSTKFLVMIPI